VPLVSQGALAASADYVAVGVGMTVVLYPLQ